MTLFDYRVGEALLTLHPVVPGFARAPRSSAQPDLCEIFSLRSFCLFFPVFCPATRYSGGNDAFLEGAIRESDDRDSRWALVRKEMLELLKNIYLLHTRLPEMAVRVQC